MRVAIIGRSEILYDTALLLQKQGHEIAVVITAKEAPEYTKTSNDFKTLSEELGADFIHTASIKEAKGVVAELDDIQIGVSMNYSGIIPQDFIDLFPLGVLNAHGGDLPRYRGNACQAWAIINAEEKIGLCIHSMIGGELDNGHIIARDSMPIDINTKVGDVWSWMHDVVPDLFVEAVNSLANDADFVLEIQSINPKDALRCYPRKPEDGEIDWRAGNENILRLINACNKPYNGAFCEYKGKKMIIWDAELVEDEEVFVSIPGQITARGKDFVDVSCGPNETYGKLRIKTVEYGDFTGEPTEIIKSLRSRLK